MRRKRCVVIYKLIFKMEHCYSLARKKHVIFISIYTLSVIFSFQTTKNLFRNTNQISSRPWYRFLKSNYFIFTYDEIQFFFFRHSCVFIFFFPWFKQRLGLDNTVYPSCSLSESWCSSQFSICVYISSLFVDQDKWWILSELACFQLTLEQNKWSKLFA